MLLRRFAWLLVAWVALATSGTVRAEVSTDYDTVNIAPTKTSIYIGSVSMTISTFQRIGGTYEASYEAKVFPYFFYNEAGQLFIPVSDERLQALARGETIEFSGRGVRTDGAERHVEGRAVPTDSTHGKIKVRVFVSKHVQLIFNTTYRFGS